jgi:hypothetical protein
MDYSQKIGIIIKTEDGALLHKAKEDHGCAAVALVRPARIQALLSVYRSSAQLLAPKPAKTPQMSPSPHPGKASVCMIEPTACLVSSTKMRLLPKLLAM